MAIVVEPGFLARNLEASSSFFFFKKEIVIKNIYTTFACFALSERGGKEQGKKLDRYAIWKTFELE